MKNRVYFIRSVKLGLAYIGKGPDPRIEHPHNTDYERLMKSPDMAQWESTPFSSTNDALIAEATAIRIVDLLGNRQVLANRQISYQRRFAPRYPFPFVDAKLKVIRHAIIVTIAPDVLRDGSGRVAPNSAWVSSKLAERARKYWQFRGDRVALWKKNKGAPRFLVAVAKGSGIILASFEIKNDRWTRYQGVYRAVPLKDKSNANANDLQGKKYIGSRRGGNVTYGPGVS
jgi:hypothetical protein